jgi:glycosyltransferase involved in cell wall biosynthesis
MRQDFHLALACRRLRIPQIVHRPVALADEPMSWWRRVLYGLVDTWTLHQCREIVACSYASAKRMQQTQALPAGKIVVVPNGVQAPPISVEAAQVARSSLGVAADSLLVVGVGQLIPRKAFHVLVEALGQVAARIDQGLECVLVGEGPERTRLSQVAQRNQVRLHMPGFVEMPASIVASAQISVLPSLAEGMPHVVLEAMALGVPTIATCVAGTPEVIEDGRSGLLIPPNNVPALTEAIIRLAQDAALRSQLGQAGQERTRSLFSLAAMIEGFLASLQRNARFQGATRGRDST